MDNEVERFTILRFTKEDRSNIEEVLAKSLCNKNSICDYAIDKEYPFPSI